MGTSELPSLSGPLHPESDVAVLLAPRELSSSPSHVIREDPYCRPLRAIFLAVNYKVAVQCVDSLVIDMDTHSYPRKLKKTFFAETLSIGVIRCPDHEYHIRFERWSHLAPCWAKLAPTIFFTKVDENLHMGVN